MQQERKPQQYCRDFQKQTSKTVNLYRSSVTLKVIEKVTEKFTEGEMSVIRLIKNNPRITTTAMSMELGKSRKTISAIIKSRKDRNVIEREGSDRNGIWIIK